MADSQRIDDLRRRVQKDPASIAFAQLAEELRRAGRFEESVEACRAGLATHPGYLSARVTLGRALIEIGDYDGARQELQTVLQSAPENLAAIRGLAQIHAHFGQSTEMHPDLQEIAREPIRLAAEQAQRARSAPAPPVPSIDLALSPESEPADDDLNLDSFDLSLSPPPDSESMLVTIADEPKTGDPFGFSTAAAPTPREPAAAPPARREPAGAPSVDVPAAATSADAPAATPDPHVTAMLQRLERFLGAIDAARHA